MLRRLSGNNLNKSPRVSSGLTYKPETSKVIKYAQLSHSGLRQRCLLIKAAGESLALVKSPSLGLQTVTKLISAWGEVSRGLQANQDEDKEVELILRALKLTISSLQRPSHGRAASEPPNKVIRLASTLADLCSLGLPLDAESIAACLLAEVAQQGLVSRSMVLEQLNEKVAYLIHDILKVRAAAQLLQVYDDIASSALRKWCISTLDIRANVVEVVSRWDGMKHVHQLPNREQQTLALESLQLYAPIGHALGLTSIGAALEDRSFQVLFPQSYKHLAAWLQDQLLTSETALHLHQQKLLTVLKSDPDFLKLASGCTIKSRRKSLFSIMKKLIQFRKFSNEGKQRAEVFDLLGLRVIVHPREDMPMLDAEEAAIKACYVVKQKAERLWTFIPERTKDYIANPKSNGYQSIHMTMALNSVTNTSSLGARPTLAEVVSVSGSTIDTDPLANDSIESTSSSSSLSLVPRRVYNHTVIIESLPASMFMELQIRTESMHHMAEKGDAAHNAYKGGIDPLTASQVKTWTNALNASLWGHHENGRLLLSDGNSSSSNKDRLALPASSKSDDTEIVVSDTVTALPVASVSEDSFGSVTLDEDDASLLAAWRLFHHLDKNGDGRLSLDEIEELMSELGETTLEAESLMSLLQTSHDDGDGITLEQFSRFHNQALKAQFVE